MNLPEINTSLFKRLRFILVETSRSGNIGAVARAMKTMGFSDLVLVNPRFPDALTDAEAVAFASGAQDILSGARIVGSIAEALEGCNYAAAVSARLREFSPPVTTPRAIAAQLAAGTELHAAVIFGNERFGLPNEIVEQCNVLINIPANPAYSSLNLSQAAQVVAYECRVAALDTAGDGQAASPVGFHGDAASLAQVDGMYAHLEQALVAIDFLDADNPKKLMPRLKRLFSRTGLETEEVNILRGIARHILAVAKKKPMIETRLLRQFIAVAEELNFRRAAERLHMAQPPLSQAILRLEELLGYPVFERTNRKVSLSPAGSAFLVTARQVLASLEEGVAGARRVAQGIEGHVRLSFIHITPYAHVLAALRAFRAASPGVQFTLREASTQQQVDWLERGDVDIALLRAPGRGTPGLRFERLSGEDIVVALPSDHRCAGQARVDLAHLAGDDFVASPRELGQGFHDQLASLCLHAGFVPRVAQQARRLQTVLGLVAAGFGVALLPASLAASMPAGVVMLPLASSAPAALRQLDLYMAWDTQRASPVRERLLAQLRHFATH